MQFKLIENGDSIRKHDKDILTQVISNLKDDKDSYIILESKQPINNSIYLQVTKELETYKIETRLIFSSDEDFKHYSYLTTSQEEVINIFASYYTDCKLPDIRSWTDETSAFKEEEERDMVKLYKESDGTIYYFEMWIDEEEILTTHKGILGEIGETSNINNKNLPPQIEMAKAIEKYLEQGYSEDITLTELIIQYPIEKRAKPTDVTGQIEDVEACLNNCLGWTGNGHCDGGDYAYDIATFFCYVVDKDIAATTIVDALEQDNLLFAGLKIAYADEKTEEYQLIYPNSGTFDL